MQILSWSIIIFHLSFDYVHTSRGARLWYRQFSQLSDLRDPDLDLWSGHTAYRCVSLIDLYLHTVLNFVKKRSNTWYSAPSRHGHHKGAQVHGADQAASHVPALYLPSYSRYSFTDPEWMEGWVSPGPGCKQQLAHGCYTTAGSQRTRTHDLSAAGQAR